MDGGVACDGSQVFFFCFDISCLADLVRRHHLRPRRLEIPWLAARCTSPSRYQCVCAAVCPLAASPTAHVCQGRWTPWTSPVPGLWYAVLLLTMRGPGSLPGSAAFLVVTTCHSARRPSPRPLTFCKPPSRIPLLLLPRSPSLVLRGGALGSPTGHATVPGIDRPLDTSIDSPARSSFVWWYTCDALAARSGDHSIHASTTKHSTASHCELGMDRADYSPPFHCVPCTTLCRPLS